MNTIKFLKSKLGYGVGAIGLDLSYGMFYSFLAQYLTNVLKLKPGFLLVLTPIARLWDGINDPMMGTIVDNTNTKMGEEWANIFLTDRNGVSYAETGIEKNAGL